MMETAKIRQSGYPIRYSYPEFVDRFRYLGKLLLVQFPLLLLFIPGKAIPPSHKGDCKESTKKICDEVFKNGEDYQMGNTKLFLKHVDNEILESLRSQILAK